MRFGAQGHFALVLHIFTEIETSDGKSQINQGKRRGGESDKGGYKNYLFTKQGKIPLDWVLWDSRPWEIVGR